MHIMLIHQINIDPLSSLTNLGAKKLPPVNNQQQNEMQLGF